MKIGGTRDGKYNKLSQKLKYCIWNFYVDYRFLKIDMKRMRTIWEDEKEQHEWKGV